MFFISTVIVVGVTSTFCMNIYWFYKIASALIANIKVCILIVCAYRDEVQCIQAFHEEMVMVF